MKYDSFSSLPPYQIVVTSAEDYSWVDQKNLVAVRLAANIKNVLILKTEKCSMQLLNQLHVRLKKEFHITETALTTAEIIADVYRGAQTVVERLEISETEALQVFHSWLQLAVDRGATDIHIESGKRFTRLRLRIDTRLILVNEVETQLARQAVQNAYLALADESSRSDSAFSFDSYRSCIIAHDVKIPVTGETRSLRFRLQSNPTISGLDVILRVPRISKTDAVCMSFEDMGYLPSQIQLITAFVSRRDQLLLVCGSTCSGKTELLNTIYWANPNRRFQKTIEIGDPIEIENPEISQISIKRSTQSDSDGAQAYGEASRSLLRSDPDVAIFSEIRGRDVGDVITQLVQSGHQTRATLHATGPFVAVARACSSAIGIDRETMCGKDFLGLVIFNALVPRLCPDCKTDVMPGDVSPTYVERIKEIFKLDSASGIRWASQSGCPKCLEGVKGLVVASEVVRMDAELLDLLRQGKDAEAEKVYRRKRIAGFADSNMTGKTAFEHGLYHVLTGVVDPRHLEAAFESFDEYSLKVGTGSGWGDVRRGISND